MEEKTIEQFDYIQTQIGTNHPYTPSNRGTG